MKQFLLIIFLSTTLAAYSQESTPAQPEYQIKKVYFFIDGYSQPLFLRHFLQIDHDKIFQTQQELLQYLDRKVQELKNLRIYNKIAYSLAFSEESQLTKVDVNFKLEDSWTLIPIPYPEYDSNNGLLSLKIGLKTFYDNVFGTLMDGTLTTNMVIRKKADDQAEISTWVFNLELARIPFFGKYLNGNISQRKIEEKKDSASWNYYATAASLGLNFEHPFNLAQGVSLALNVNYNKKALTDITVARQEMGDNETIISASHNLSFADVNWLVNFRKGYSLSLGNTLAYPIGDPSPDYTGNFQAKAYYPLKIFCFSGRFLSQWNAGEEITSAGSNIRGVKDSLIYGNLGFFLNSNLTIRFLKIKGLAEAHISPFFDFGMMKETNKALSYDNWEFGTGFDGVLYIDKLKSVTFRGTIGIDLKRPPWSYENGKFSLRSDRIEILIESGLFF